MCWWYVPLCFEGWEVLRLLDLREILANMSFICWLSTTTLVRLIFLPYCTIGMRALTPPWHHVGMLTVFNLLRGAFLRSSVPLLYILRFLNTLNVIGSLPMPPRCRAADTRTFPQVSVKDCGCTTDSTGVSVYVDVHMMW